MKKKIALSMIVLATVLSADTNWNESIIYNLMNPSYLSVEKGGTKSMIDAYSDGVGIIIIGDTTAKLDNSPTNILVYKYGEEAKEAGQLLADYVLANDIASIEDKNLAQKIKDQIGIKEGDICDDGNSNTINDKIINGICVGKEAALDCLGDNPVYITREVLMDKIVNGEDITNVCTSHITDMSGLFYYWGNYTNLTDEQINNFRNFNQDISKWDTSNVTDMNRMFANAYTFNQDISGWDTSNVTDMNRMFSNAYIFNQDISGWNVSNVTDMNYMFFEAHAFNQPIGNWDVSKVTDMSVMFGQAKSFNQNINNWNVSNVTDMKYMFYRAEVFNQPLNNWDVSNVTNMQIMFFQAFVFNQPLGNWDVSNVEPTYGMNSMFKYAFQFNQDLTSWNVVQFTNGEPQTFVYEDNNNFSYSNRPKWGTTGE